MVLVFSRPGMIGILQWSGHWHTINYKHTWVSNVLPDSHVDKNHIYKYLHQESNSMSHALFFSRC